MRQQVGLRVTASTLSLVAWLALFAIMAMGPGCSTTRFTKLPKPEEFKKPLTQLKAEYPDLTKYESEDPLINHPYAGQLNDAWGKPHSTDFWFLGIFNPFHAKYRRWEFEGKSVTAYIFRPIVYGFKPHVWVLTIEELK